MIVPLLLFLTTLVLSECNSGRCSTCVQNSDFGIGCRWCPKSNRCFPYADPYNVCSSSEEIKKESDCPADPARTTAYSEEMATIMMQYASAVYMLPFHANKTFQPGFKVLANLSFPLPKSQTGHVLLGVLPSHNHIALAIDGTQDIDELFEEVANATFHDFMPDQLPGAKVVGYFLAGFASAFHTVQDDLRSALNAYPNYALWLSGHSLGGAIAAIFGISLAVNMNMTNGRDIKLYTFGEPRVGNKAFADAFNKHLTDAYRIVNARDLIAHIPPCNLNPMATHCEGWGYHHGTEIWYSSGDYTNGNMCWYRECIADPFGEDESCSNQFSHFIIDDHYGYWDVLFNGGWCGTWKNSKIQEANRFDPAEKLHFNQTKYDELEKQTKLRL